jgi:hypothetical protein
VKVSFFPFSLKSLELSLTENVFIVKRNDENTCAVLRYVGDAEGVEEA